MNEWLWYLLQSGICLTLLYTLYWTFLKQETFFRLNRIYLLSAIPVSFIIPLFKLPSPFRTVTAPVSEDAFGAISDRTVEALTFTDIVAAVYFAGFLFFFLRFAMQILGFYRLVRKYPTLHYGEFHLVDIHEPTPPFSFFRYVFLHTAQFSDDEIQRILAHEHIHVRQHHSIDLIVMECLTIIQWFNPFVWPYKRALKETHEYLADVGVIAQGFNAVMYQKLILEQIVGEKLFALSNNFQQSQVKRRLTMMMKHKPTKFAKLKLLLILPVLAVLLLAFSKPRVVAPIQANPMIAPVIQSEMSDDAQQVKQDKVKMKQVDSKKKVAAIDEKVAILKKKYETAESEEDKKAIKEQVMALNKEREVVLASAKKEGLEVKTDENGELPVKKTSASYAEMESELVSIDKEIEILKVKYKKAESEKDKETYKKKLTILLDKKEKIKKEMAAQDPPKKKKVSKTKASTE